MKKVYILLIVLMMLLAACGGAEPAPVPVVEEATQSPQYSLGIIIILIVGMLVALGILIKFIASRRKEKLIYPSNCNQR